MGILLVMVALAQLPYTVTPAQPEIRASVRADVQKILQGPPEAPSKLIGPREATRRAAADIRSLDAEDHFYTRYYWFPEPSALKVATARYAINTAVSHAEALYPGVLVGGDQVLRVDLRELLPDPKDLARFLAIERKLALTEPYHHIPNLSRGSKDGLLYTKVKCKPYVWPEDGKTYRFQVVPLATDFSQFAKHTGLSDMATLYEFTGSNMPICRADWFQTLILTTLTVGRTKGVYYELRGFNGLNQEQIFALLGANEADSQNLGGDARSAIFWSGVTDRQRRMDAFAIRGVRLTSGFPIITVSHDIALADVDPEQDPLLNILNVKDSAREVIAVSKNGMLVAVLFNGQGVLQEVVPDQIAHDSTVQSPSPRTLVPIISCLACHNPHDGFIPHGNDVRDLYFQYRRLGKNQQAQFEDDLNEDNRFEALDKAYGLYKGELNNVYVMAQAMHATATAELTGRFTPAEIGAELVRTRNEYQYGRWDNLRMMRDIGLDVQPQGKKPADQQKYLAALFAEVVPPLGGKSNDDPTARILEDGRIVPLLYPKRKTLNAAQAEAVYPDIANRAYERLVSDPALEN